jgi:hypothetical protein
MAVVNTTKEDYLAFCKIMEFVPAEQIKRGRREWKTRVLHSSHYQISEPEELLGFV